MGAEMREGLRRPVLIGYVVSYRHRAGGLGQGRAPLVDEDPFPLQAMPPSLVCFPLRV